MKDPKDHGVSAPGGISRSQVSDSRRLILEGDARKD